MIADSKLDSAVSKEFWLLEEEESEDNSESSEVLWMPDTDMNRVPFDEDQGDAFGGVGHFSLCI